VPKAPSRPRILVAAQDFPWPSTGGSLQRLSLVIEELSQIGDVEVFCLVHPRRERPTDVPASIAIQRWTTVVEPEPDLSPNRRPRWLRSGLPMELSAQDFGTVQRRFRRWARDRYDLVWVSKITTWVSLGGPRLGPTILDLDDLEDRKARAAFDVTVPARAHGLRSRAHLLGARVQTTENVRRWAKVQREAAADCEHVALCSDLDVRRSGLSNAVVVANGYVQPAPALARYRPAAAKPVVLLQGVLHYAPNVDAARWLVADIAPRLRTMLPGTSIRLVGTAHPPVEALADPPAVAVVGWVADIADELARADVVAVPLRFGSGTRIKILEAFAHRIPVVSTTLGAEGLAAEDEQHLLLADDADAFAAACVRVLTDEALRVRLTDAAHTLYEQRHTDSTTRSAVRTAAESVLGRWG
jgi:glycosyltransferase involved in cell wall biosynthesis